jgi:TPP-dependent pyruvate/acetoin dehydrogenase alpha subunit
MRGHVFVSQVLIALRYLENSIMNSQEKLDLARKLISMRFVQMFINERYKNKEFEIPIHLAMGHEAIALAVGETMASADRLVLSHRNIHYNIARGATLQMLLDEYLLKPEGLAGGKQGSMNLTNPDKGIPYTSSILGNNLGVGAGVALGIKAKKSDGVTFIVTGDGAMEEGSFYETLLLLAAQKLPTIIIIENNGWSLGSTIEERRAPIDVKSVAEGTGAGYAQFSNNDVFDYTQKMMGLRERSKTEKRCFVVEVVMNTLGDWRLKTDEFPDGKFINYHAGPAPTVELKDWPAIQEDVGDPLFVVSSLLPMDTLVAMAHKVKLDLSEVA